MRITLMLLYGALLALFVTVKAGADTMPDSTIFGDEATLTMPDDTVVLNYTRCVWIIAGVERPEYEIPPVACERMRRMN